MQNLKEPLYYSNFRPGLDVELDDDRELLVEEQKSCRARARKFCLETNRRRKALEERRRQWDVQEQRLREKILQQRKQRVQDATERFQRAHLPPSLRRRPGSGKRVPNLDEALGQIHGSLGSYVQHSLISRSCTPSPKPPGGSSGPHSRRVVSAAEAYSRLMQERSLSEFKSSQLIFLNQLQETEHQPQVSPQEHPDTPPSPSESLSSLDSLENEIPQQGHGTSPARSSSFLDPPGIQNVQNPASPQQLNLLTQSKSFLEEVLSQQGSPSSSSSSPSLGESADSADSADDDLQSLQDLTQALELCNLNDQSESFYTQSTPCCQNVHAQQDLTTNSGHMAYCYDSTVHGNASRECKALHIEPDTTPLEFASLTRQEPKLLGRKLEEKCTKHPSENCPFQPVNGCRHKNDLSQASSSASRVVASNVDAGSSIRFGGSCHASQLDSSNSANSQFCKKIPDADKANQKESKPINHEEKCRNEDPSNLREECSNRRIVATAFKSSKSSNSFNSSRTGEESHKTSENTANYGENSKNEDPSNLPNEFTNRTLATTMSSKPSKSSRTGEEPDQTSKAYLTPTTTTRCTDVRFLKGILKKNSKYMVGDAKFTQTYTAGNFIFTRQVAMSIRDSMELTRAKVREPENDKSVKKKLRWFDEVNGDEENVKSKPGHLPQNIPSSMDVNHQQELYQLASTNAPTGTLGRISSATASSATSSTRQAWTDVKTQDEEPTQEPKEPKEPKIQRPGPRIPGPRIPRRVCSARNAISGPTASRNRKGTVIRPQSATEAQRVLKNQGKGKTLVPRPPPRSDQVLESQFNSAEPTVYITTKTAYNPWDSDCPHNKPDNTHPDNQPPASHHHFPRAEAEGALPAPAPPSYAYTYETVSKGIYALCQPEAQAGSARRPLQFRENGICLDRTPTDEEISLLWHGVRSALASKEVGDPRSFLAPSGPLSALPQGHANLSHVTINGDSLLSGVKAVTRMGQFFLSPSNVRTPVRRPTVESNMVKNRDKKHQLIYQATVPISGYSSKADQTAQDEEVLDSGVQVAVDVSQLQRAGVVHRGQVFGLSALSLEEQRLLQSLDRLNHRLQYVQDMSAGNTALKGVFTLDSANNQSPQTGEVLGGTQRRYHNGSAAENRTRSHRRY
ncbi:centrosomal protein of 126 kDa isoform X1 [Astyanax mexicanus]|uniref:Centrosomal protein of 126 kDa isoform X1 n=1 Tax=Astyanax mexicanus TaxID=7994 RepID=A0A8T2LL13_ASTMX|nr:centrosomal protein of 126 kDa isoform X1 [Astyanax mexicanus]